MKPLDITKKYDLSQLNDEQLQSVLDWLKENDTGWNKLALTYFKEVSEVQSLIYNSEYEEWVWLYCKKESVNALELFEKNKSVYDDMLSLIEKGKQHGLKIVVTFEKL